MKKNLLFIFAALFIFSAQAQNTLKLMSYNIKNANGMDNVCNFQRIANKQYIPGCGGYTGS